MARFRCPLWPSLALGLALLLPRVVQADPLTNYSVEVIARLGDKVGDAVFTDFLSPGRLNDNGQLVFTAGVNHHSALVQYSDGGFTVVAMAGGPAPGGPPWPPQIRFATPISMNEAGDIVFAPTLPPAGFPYGVWLWKHGSRRPTDVADKGTLADGNLHLTNAGGPGGATITNRGEIAFQSYFYNALGQGHPGVLVRSTDGQLQSVALPGDALPGNDGAVIDAFASLVNDAGLVAFTADSKQEPLDAAYLWQNGAIRVIADAGTEIPGFGKVVGATVIGLNNNGGALVAAQTTPDGPNGLFLWNQGQFTPAAVPGQAMPGGGAYLGDPQESIWGFGSAAGALPFLGHVEEGGVPHTAVYTVGADGKVSLILKSGMTTNLGTITGIGTGIALNSQGQVALPMQIYDGPSILVLLTPTAS